MNLNKIHLKNFRIFRDQGFTLRPLTVIVGPNSSGKSSIFKALQLLNENIEECGRLLFTDKTHGLGSFELTKTRDTEGGLEISLRHRKSLSDPNGHNPQSFEITYSYVFDKLENSLEPIAELKIFRLLVDEKVLLEVESEYIQQKRGSRGEAPKQPSKKSTISLKPDVLLRLLYATGDVMYWLYSDVEEYEPEEFGSDIEEEENKEVKTIEEQLKEEVKKDVDESLKQLQDYKPYKPISEKSVGEILKPEGYLDEENDFFYSWMKEIEDVDSNSLIYQHDLFVAADKRLKEVLGGANSPLPIFSFPAFRGLQQHFYRPSEEKGTLENVIFEYWRNKSSFDRAFLNKWLYEFEIVAENKSDDDVLSVEKLGDLSNTLQIKIEGQNLADFGFGVTQLVPILLTVAGLSKDEEQLLLIEEPESHLHPKLQTKLADFFEEAMKKFKVRFAVETHSEYLIHKLRLLAKDSDELRDNLVMHYINAKEEEFKEITIDENGTMSDEFGDGFTDESSRLLEQFWDF